MKYWKCLIRSPQCSKYQIKLMIAPTASWQLAWGAAARRWWWTWGCAASREKKARNRRILYSFPVVLWFLFFYFYFFQTEQTVFFFLASAALTEAEAWSEVTDAVWWRNCPRSEEKMVAWKKKKQQLLSSYGKSGSWISQSTASVGRRFYQEIQKNIGAAVVLRKCSNPPKSHKFRFRF